MSSSLPSVNTFPSWNINNTITLHYNNATTTPHYNNTNVSTVNTLGIQLTSQTSLLHKQRFINIEPSRTAVNLPISTTDNTNPEQLSDLLTTNQGTMVPSSVRSTTLQYYNTNTVTQTAESYEVFIYSFYGIALLLLMLSMCLRRTRFNPYDIDPDKDDQYEDYLKTKEYVHKLSVRQRLKRMKRLWNAPVVYKLPVHTV